MDTRNLFIALRPDADSRELLQHATEALMLPSSLYTRIQPEDYHLTLRYLGPTAPQDIPRISTLLQDILPSLTFSGIVLLMQLIGLSSLVSPRVIAYEAEASKELLTLAAQIRTLHTNTPDTDGIGMKRAFLPHVSIARATSHGGTLANSLPHQKYARDLTHTNIQPISLQASELILYATTTDSSPYEHLLCLSLTQ